MTNVHFLCDSPAAIPSTVQVLSMSLFDCSMAIERTWSMCVPGTINGLSPPLLSSILTLPNSNGIGFRLNLFWNVVSSRADLRRMWSRGSSTSILGVM